MEHFTFSCNKQEAKTHNLQYSGMLTKLHFTFNYDSATVWLTTKLHYKIVKKEELVPKLRTSSPLQTQTCWDIFWLRLHTTISPFSSYNFGASNEHNHFDCNELLLESKIQTVACLHVGKEPIISLYIICVILCLSKSSSSTCYFITTDNDDY